MIVMSSARPGEFAWYGGRGGLFTVDRLLPILRRPPTADAPMIWRMVMQRAIEPIPVAYTEPVSVPGLDEPVAPGPAGFRMHPQWASRDLVSIRR